MPVAGEALPQIRFGEHSLSRLVCRSNKFADGSHSSIFLTQHLKQDYTPDQILKTLRRVTNDTGANELINPHYRHGWTL